MRTRRAILLALLGFLAVALGASITAPREQSAQDAPAGPPAPLATSQGAPEELTLTGKRQRREPRPKVYDYELGDRVLLSVETSEPGQVTVGGLGRLAPSGPNTPASFDLLLDRAGDYEVVLTGSNGNSSVLARLAVEPPS